MRIWILLVTLAIAVGSAADFAAQTGFSGRVANCTQCHPAPAFGNDAVAVLEGLPDAWLPGEAYPLRVAVEGGPPAAPAPQPQGGFEIETQRGAFVPADGDDALYRFARPWHMTYEPPGTLMRSWSFDYQAPDLTTMPEPLTFWLAVVSANGNHVIATNVSDGGEHGDAAAVMHKVVPPHEDALAMWRALPLLPPEVDGPNRLVAQIGAVWTIQGEHTDRNATHLAHRIDGGEWVERATPAAWRLQVPFVDGIHVLELRSLGADRTSPPIQFTLEGRADGPAVPAAPGQDVPVPGILLMVALLAVAWVRR